MLKSAAELCHQYSSTDDLLPVHWVTKHFHFEPLLIIVLEVVWEVDALTEHAVDAVVDRFKVRSDTRCAVPTTVESVDARSQRTLFSLEIPRTCIHVYDNNKDKLLKDHIPGQPGRAGTRYIKKIIIYHHFQSCYLSLSLSLIDMQTSHMFMNCPFCSWPAS